MNMQPNDHQPFGMIDMPMVPQRNAYDCGIAAMAMLYDMTYEEAESCFPVKCGDPAPWDGDVPYGITPLHILWTGLHRGFKAALIHPSEAYAGRVPLISQHSPMPDIKGLWTWLQGRRAVMVVPNQTVEGNVHFCAWNGRYLVDPLYKRHPARHYRYDDRPALYEVVVRF